MTFLIILFVIFLIGFGAALSYHFSVKWLENMHQKTLEAQQKRDNVYKQYILMLKIFRDVLIYLKNDNYDISEIPLPWEKKDDKETQKAV